jgi:hypothetical protein
VIDTAAARRLAINNPLREVVTNLCDEVEDLRAVCTRTVRWLVGRASAPSGRADAALDAAIRDLRGHLE